MRSRLTWKFLLGYLALGLFSYALIASVSSWMIEQHTINRLGHAIYDEAYYLSNIVSNHDPELEDMAFLAREAGGVSTYTDAEVWFTTPEGRIIYCYPSPRVGQLISDFDPADRSGSLYSLGTFYGIFPDEVITATVPVINGFSISGYVILHLGMDAVHEQTQGLLRIVYITGAVIYIASFIFLVMLRVMVENPLEKISRAAKEYSEGNLDYRIDISKYDEMGQLAATLNTMSSEIKDAEDTQRKFVSNISHDFRSPLTSIKGYLEAMLDGTIPPEKHAHYLEVVLHETERLQKMTQTTLQLQSIEANGRMLDMEDFDINDLIRDTAASFEGSCVARGLVLDLTFEEEHLRVRADKSKISQVLYNLIDNAIKFSEDENDIWVETYTKGGKCFVSVKDAGAGIPAKELPKIWNRFYKGDSSRGINKNSTGLGLAISREIIQNHGQTIDVISTEGAGSEFIFTLQRAPESESGR